MALALRRSYLKAKNNLLCSTCSNVTSVVHWQLRNYSDDKFNSNPQFSSTTIMMEHGYNVQELPVVVRKLKDFSDIVDKAPADPRKVSTDSHNYHLIQEEFKQCADLRDVFSLLSKCTKITPNIALGALERIYDLEKESLAIDLESKSVHINLAKGAILDKLLKVVVKTEDTITILNILNTGSIFMEPYKHKFTDELLFRVLDNKLSVEQLCLFLKFLIENKSDPKYSETIDKLWVGFVERQADVNETNVANIFGILHGLKSSKRTVLTLLEQKLYEIWYKIDVSSMQEILDTFVKEKYLSMQSFAVVGRWLHTNIHALDDDSLLDIITKVTRLNYTDDQIEKAVDKYMKLKCTKIKNHILIVGILNFSMQFQIRNEHILNACSEYFLRNGYLMPASFLKSIIYPYGFLNYDPLNFEFWQVAEDILHEKFEKFTADDLCSIILSFIYMEKYPLKLVRRIYTAEYLMKINDPVVLKKLHLIDTALSLECPDYAGPLLPKDQWLKPIIQDHRLKNIISKTMDHFVNVVGDIDNLSTSVLIPYFCSDETYLVDIMIHPKNLMAKNSDWKSKSNRNENIAILINLPDHFCSDNETLIGPQLMRKKHLKILGFKVVNLKYSILSQFYTSYNTAGMRQYLIDSIENAEPCI